MTSPPVERPETPPNPSIVIPFSRDTDFVERGILDQIHQKCAVLGSRTALVGLGGVFWVHASNAARFEQSFRDVTDRVKIPGRQNPTANIFQLWALILNNVDDAGFLVEARRTGQEGQASGIESADSRSLVSYLPQCLHGSILITTRSEDEALNLVEQRDIITIEPINNKDALTLFENKLGGVDDGSNDADVAAKLLVTLEFMPLAIVQAATYILRRKSRYSVRETSLLDYNGKQLRRDKEAKNLIIVTWQILFDHIRKIRPLAADLLSLMSFFDRQGIPDTLLQNRSERTKSNDDDVDITSQSLMNNGFKEDVLVLRNYSFISVNANGTTFEMHGLVQLVTRKWLEAHGQIERWKHQFIKNLDVELLMGEYENWEKSAQRPKEQDSLLNWALILYNIENIAVYVMKVRKKILGDEHSDTLNGMVMVGLAYSLNSWWDAAEELEVQVMETRKTKLGADHLDTLTSINNLVFTWKENGKETEAIRLIEDYVRVRKRVLGVNHPHSISSYTALDA
ncbi:hypothetical protein DL95DRAFT_510730 [Leptodontidium sp. 2 PMI_412]|nr:hypothetical protein DL95DRAFT_510730 [Leptodontidium sp. 2 PMI_412]